jgi:hypothetical protein
VIRIPGRFFNEVASPAITRAMTAMSTEVSSINSGYSAASEAVRNAALALETSCVGGCCSFQIPLFSSISSLGALNRTFDPNAFSGFLNSTLNDKLKEGKDVINNANIPSATIESYKDFPKMVPPGTGFILFVPVFLPLLINFLSFLCKKQCPFWCSHICGFLFSGLVFLLFIVVFLVGSMLSETCNFLPSASESGAVDVSGIDAMFPPAADGSSNGLAKLFQQCFAKKTGGNMFLAVSYNISHEINVIVEQNINKETLGLDSDAINKLEPIPQSMIDACNSNSTNKANLEALRTAQMAMSTFIGNIDVTTRGSVSRVLVGFANQISSCDVLADGYLKLRDSICGGFSDSIIATYFSLYGCGIFLILFLITTTKIVKKVSRSSAVIPEQAPKVAGAPPDAAAAMAPSAKGAASAPAKPTVTQRSDAKETRKAS